MFLFVRCIVRMGADCERLDCEKLDCEKGEYGKETCLFYSIVYLRQLLWQFVCRTVERGFKIKKALESAGKL